MFGAYFFGYAERTHKRTRRKSSRVRLAFAAFVGYGLLCVFLFFYFVSKNKTKIICKIFGNEIEALYLCLTKTEEAKTLFFKSKNSQRFGSETLFINFFKKNNYGY